jgi:hypothetical protein
MGLLDSLTNSITGKKRKAYTASTTFRITEQGREKLQNYAGDPDSQILVALETRGSSNIDEIAGACQGRVSRGQVERRMPVLVRQGYAQETSAGMEDD